MYDERKAWFSEGSGVDDGSKDLLTILSMFKNFKWVNGC
jgi:hypothetical protein